MVGNDIVDLKLAKIESNWQRPGFLTKIFTEKERKMIECSSDPFQLVWLFWSMKESAYKCYVQKKSIRFYAPTKLECELLSATEGLVLFEDKTYYTNSKITKNYISTEAQHIRDAKTEHYHFEFNTRTSAKQSEIIRDELKKITATTLNVPFDSLSIKKNSVGVPKLYLNNKQLQASFSMSHHGNYGVYSIVNTNR